MKNKILFLISLSFLLISCNNFLDEMPDNRAEIDSKQKIQKLLVSAYPLMSHWCITEYYSDNTDDNGKLFATDFEIEQPYFFWSDNIDAIYQDTPQSIWDGCYSAIAASNHALRAIDELGNEDGNLNAEKGEALITRAYGHFILVNVFCKHYNSISSSADLGIPYMEKPETEVNPDYSRGTVAEVYQKINADIEAALSLIQDDLYSIPKYHFNKRAAYAFAARFNLYYENYDNTIKYADLVLGTTNASALSVLRNWQAFGSAGSEVRSNVFIDASNPANLLIRPAVSYWGALYGPYMLGNRYAHNQIISENETMHSTGVWGAYTNFYARPTTLTQGLPKYVFWKQDLIFEELDAIGGTGYYQLVHIDFTTDETLLCRAEAYIHKKLYDNALSDINLFLTAFARQTTPVTAAIINNFYSTMPYYTPKSPTAKKRLNPDFPIEEGQQENFIQCLLHTRRILTLHEGLRWFDIKRYGIEVNRRKVETGFVTVYDDMLSKDDLRRAIQLPKNVISAGLEPNPRN